MLLFENLNELHKIDRSILNQLISYTSSKSKLAALYSYFNMSQNSKIYIDTLKRSENGKSIHTWKYATEAVLEKDDVAGIILRSNKRQLLGIFKRGSVYKLFPSETAVDLSNFSNANMSRYNSETSSLISVRNKMAALVKAFLEDHPNAKKNWDIMIVMKDNTIDKTKEDRANAIQGMEIKPKQKEQYKQYIQGLKDNLSKRLEIYVNSKLKNITQLSELQDVMNNNPNIFVKKIKIAGLIYVLDDMSASISRGRESFEAVATYKIQNPPSSPSTDYYYTFYEVKTLTIRFVLQGKQMKLGSIYFGRDEENTFEKGMQYIINKKEEKNIK